MITITFIYCIINIIMFIAAMNEGDIIPKEMYWRGRLVYAIFIILFGCLILGCLILWVATKPFITKYKRYKRRKKIRKAIMEKELRDRPRDVGVGIF